MDKARLLLADDEREILETYGAILTRAGHQVDTATSGTEVLERIRAFPYDLLLCDLMFPPTDGIEVLREIKKLRPSTLVVLVSGYANVANVMAAFRAGAFDFVEKPVPPDKLCELADRALEVRKLGEERRRMAEELQNERARVMKLEQQLSKNDPFEKIVGHSTTVRQLIETVREVARTDSTVLMTGESGTGKGLVSRIIHEAGARADGPFVEANCVVYSEGVLHSELFGHERGAFTGAARTKKGRFELARGGTLFLDEIGDISHATQLLLLRVLQDRTFERVGGEETLETDVRLIAATNRDLSEAIRQGAFRSDLFYRLNVIPVHLPPLREHAEDVPLLAQKFLDRCATRLGRRVEGFLPEAMEALLRHPWPGNVRELENLIERVVVLNRTGVIGLDDLPPAFRGGAARAEAVAVAGGPSTLQAMERRGILEALRDANGNKKKAARALGIHRSTLYAKMRRYGLDDAKPAEERSEDRHEVSDLATVPSLR
jgi:two-component system response regulator HydG